MQSEALRFEAQADVNMELGFREVSVRRLLEKANRDSQGENERQEGDFSEGSDNDFADSASSGELRMAADLESSDSEDDE